MFKPANYFEVTPIEVANAVDLIFETATLIGLRRESALYGELRLKRALFFLKIDALGVNIHTPSRASIFRFCRADKVSSFALRLL